MEKLQYEKVFDLCLENKTSLIVIDDYIDLKITKTENGYKILILENNCCDIDVAFSDNVEEFEN